MPRVCDYEGSQYRTEFWESQNRQYEDLAERIALRQLLPQAGKTIIEVGAGFGRLVDLYQGYEKIVLMDYARTQLEEAQRYLGHDDRYIFVAADIYNLPFKPHVFDALVMVRVMHHLADVPAALQGLQMLLHPQGIAVIEHANKRHLKAVLRWLLRQQTWNPFDREPYEFVELNFDFHPAWMRQQFAQAGFSIQEIRTVSHYRLPWLKSIVSPSVLAALDGMTQPTGRWFQYTPSVFLQATVNKPPLPPQIDTTSLFRCPTCHSESFQHQEAAIQCLGCHSHWSYQNGIYDFKTPQPV